LNLLFPHAMSLVALSARRPSFISGKRTNRGSWCKILLLKGESDTLPIPGDM
jgi:hypothetical protein